MTNEERFAALLNNPNPTNEDLLWLLDTEWTLKDFLEYTGLTMELVRAGKDPHNFDFSDLEIDEDKYERAMLLMAAFAYALVNIPGMEAWMNGAVGDMTDWLNEHRS